MIDVSFIVPFRQYGPHLLRTIASILAQETTVSFEVIVVNNSSQTVPQIPRTKTYHCRKKGPAAARNMGALNASGRLLAFVDADVELDSNWLEQCHLEIKKLPTIGAVQTPLITEFDDKIRPSFLDQFRYSAKLTATEGTFVYIAKNAVVLNTAACLIRREAFNRASGFDEQLQRAEDTHFTLKLLAAGYFIGLSKHTKGHVSNDKSFWAFTMKFLHQGLSERVIQNTLGLPPVIRKPEFNSQSSLQSLYFKLTRVLYSIGYRWSRKKLTPMAYRKGEYSYNRFIQLDINKSKWKLQDPIRLVQAPNGLVFINLNNLTMAMVPIVNFNWNFKLDIPEATLQNLQQGHFLTAIKEHEVPL